MTVPKFTETNLKQLCSVMAEYVTGSQITDYFLSVGINEDTRMAKKVRLFNELSLKQRLDNCSNNIMAFIKIAFNPVNFLNDKEVFEQAHYDINRVLAFEGLQLTEQGDIKYVTKSRTISDAEARAKSLRATLVQRSIHGDVLKFCKPELMESNYFHAVLEASKSIGSKIRNKADLQDDGITLINTAFSVKAPILAINSLQTPSEISEHRGFQNLMIGIIQMFRNPTAHEAKIYWTVSERDAIDLLTTISFIHRKLDDAVLIKF